MANRPWRRSTSTDDCSAILSPGPVDLSQPSVVTYLLGHLFGRRRRDSPRLQSSAALARLPSSLQQQRQWSHLAVAQSPFSQWQTGHGALHFDRCVTLNLLQRRMDQSPWNPQGTYVHILSLPSLSQNGLSQNCYGHTYFFIFLLFI